METLTGITKSSTVRIQINFSMEHYSNTLKYSAPAEQGQGCCLWVEHGGRKLSLGIFESPLL